MLKSIVMFVSKYGLNWQEMTVHQLGSSTSNSGSVSFTPFDTGFPIFDQFSLLDYIMRVGSENLIMRVPEIF